MLDYIKNFKHFLYLGWKKRHCLIDASLTFLSGIRRYRYNPDKYRRKIGDIVVPKVSTFNINHLDFSAYSSAEVKRVVPHKVFVCWTGDNEISDSRRESLKRIIEDNPDFEVVLVSSENYKEFTVPGHPIHPVYERLSYVHRSDYLRAYLMYHHGGVYTDIKILDKPWADIVSKLNQSDAWAAGPAEMKSSNVSPAWGLLGKHQRLYWKKVLFPAAYAFKPGTPLAKEWLAEVERRLDYFSRLLLAHESKDPVWGLDEFYPVPWNAIMGQIFSPLCLKYHDKILVDDDIKFVVNQGGYR